MPGKGKYGFYSKRTPYTRQFDEIAKYGDQLDMVRMQKAQAAKAKKPEMKEMENQDITDIPANWANNTEQIKADVKDIFIESYNDPTLSENQSKILQQAAEAQIPMMKQTFDDANELVERIAGPDGDFMDVDERENMLSSLRNFIRGDYTTNVFVDKQPGQVAGRDKINLNMIFTDNETGERLSLNEIRREIENYNDGVTTSQLNGKKFDDASKRNGYYDNPQTLLRMGADGYWHLKEATNPEVVNTYRSSFDAAGLPEFEDGRNYLGDMWIRDKQKAESLMKQLNAEIDGQKAKAKDEYDESFYEYRNIVPEIHLGEDGSMENIIVGTEKNKGQNTPKMISLLHPNQDNEMKIVNGVARKVKFDKYGNVTRVLVNIVESTDRWDSAKQQQLMDPDYSPVLTAEEQWIDIQPDGKNYVTAMTHFYKLRESTFKHPDVVGYLTRGVDTSPSITIMPSGQTWPPVGEEDPSLNEIDFGDD